MKFHKSSSGNTTSQATQGNEKDNVILYRPRDAAERKVKSQHLNDPAMSYWTFLQYHTCYDILPQSCKLVAFDIELNVAKCFSALVVNNVRAAMLWHSAEQRFVGLLTISDFIKILYTFYQTPEYKFSDIEFHNLTQWKKILKDDDKPLIYVSPDQTLLEASHLLHRHKIHRLPVIDPYLGNALSILTHKRILKYLHMNMKQLPLPQYMTKTLEQLNVGTYGNIHKITLKTPLIQALELFITKNVSALPVCDAHGKLVDVYAKFDVINLAAKQTYNKLDVSVEEVLPPKTQPIASCRKTDTFYDVFNQIVNAEVHRLVIVDKSKHVIGILSLSDILKLIITNK